MNLKIYLFFILINILLFFNLLANNFPTPDFKEVGNNFYEITVFDHWQKDLKSLRMRLREEAELEILKSKGLLEINSETLDIQNDKENLLKDYFSHTITTNIYGRIDSICVVEEKSIIIDNNVYYVMRFKGHIIEESPDKDYLINSTLNKSSFLNGEELIIFCTVNKDSYLNIFNFDIDEDKITLLFPNKFFKNNKIEKNQKFILPPEKSSKKIKVYTDGLKSKSSYIIVLATKANVIFPEFINNFDSFKNWINKIPLSQRSINFLSYFVIDIK